MIDYETYCRIQHLHRHDALSVPQIGRALGLDPRTVSTWLEVTQFRPRQAQRRTSKLDPYKRTIVQLVERHPYSAVQIYQRLREQGYDGGITILKDYLLTVRPVRAPAFLTLAFAPGECAQIDWGQWGSITVGNTRRRLSFFLMVLCYSRLLYLEFTVSQSMEFFLACHLHAFEFFGGRVPAKIMLDNLKSAVLQRLTGQAPVFNPRYRDFAAHHDFQIVPCGIGKGNEKGRVENGIGYVKKNFLNGLDLPDFSAMNPAAQQWRDRIANVRIHGETHQRPLDLFRAEQAQLQPMPVNPYDIATVHTVRASNRFRVRLDTNRYSALASCFALPRPSLDSSVPAEYASRRLTLKADADYLRVYHHDQLIARHSRRFDRHRDFEDPDHPRALLAQRRSARQHKLLQRFLALCPTAERYYQAMQLRRLNPQHPVQKIIALSEIYGLDRVARAIEDACEFQAFSCEYIANLLESRARALPEPGALHLTRRQDLLELDLPEPDLALYDPDPATD